MARKNPISEDRFRELEKAVLDLSNLRGECMKYEACGIDCADRMAACDYLQGQIQTILDVWRDGKPVPQQVQMSVQ